MMYQPEEACVFTEVCVKEENKRDPNLGRYLFSSREQTVIDFFFNQQGCISFNFHQVAHKLTKDGFGNLIASINDACFNRNPKSPDIDIFATPFSPAQIASILGLSVSDFLSKVRRRRVTSSCPHPYDNIGLHQFFTVIDVFSVVYEGPISPLAAASTFAFYIPETAEAIFNIDLQTCYEVLPEVCEDLEFESQQPVSEVDAYGYLTGLILITGLFWLYVSKEHKFVS